MPDKVASGLETENREATPSTPAQSAAPETAEAAASTRGSFRIVRSHAEGGLGRVSVADDVKLGRQVAIKELRPDRRQSPAARQRFLAEAAITGQLQHPGIVPIYVLDEQDGEPFYAMRFVEGQTLGDSIRRYHQEPNALLFRELLQRFVSVCQTVAYAHSQGMIHRDLKPTNVLLGEFGESLVVDWGLALRIAEEEPAGRDALMPPATVTTTEYRPTIQPDRLTQAGDVLGTVAYMSPEQACGDPEAVGPPTDIFALGATLFELLTGRPPYCAAKFSENLELARLGRAPRPLQINRDVPRALEAICMNAMAVRPVDRFATATELADDVNRWLADEPVRAWPEPMLARLRRWSRRHRTLVASVVAAAGLAMVFLITVTGLVQRQNDTLEKKNQELAGAFAHEREAKETLRSDRDRARRVIEALTSPQALQALLRQPSVSDAQRAFLNEMCGYYKDLAAGAATTEEERHRQALAFYQMGCMLQILEHREESEHAYRQAIALFSRLTAEFPGNGEYRQDLAGNCLNLADLLHEQTRDKEADPLYRQSVDLREKLIEEFPTEANYRDDLAFCLNNRGLTLTDLEHWDEAEAVLQQALKLRTELADRFPRESARQHDLAATLHNVAEIHTRCGNPAKAVPLLQEAIRWQRQALEQQPQDANAKQKKL
jgi:serine/threonine-protein kinase